MIICGDAKDYATDPVERAGGYTEGRNQEPCGKTTGYEKSQKF
jgi:hypothetical protein